MVINESLVRNRPVSGLLSLWQTSVGKKFVMAISGIILFGYVILHLWGNLRVFYGPEALNQWGVFLRVAGDPFFRSQQLLWIVRVILLVALILHVTAAYQLSRRDYASRPAGYALRKNLESTYASRTMRWGGVIILLFVIYHVLDLTTGTLHPATYAPFREGDIYSNVIGDFRVWYVTLIYVAAVIVLGMHLYHGVWSMFQTLGLNSSRWDRLWRNVATFFAVVLTLGNIAIPVSILIGIVR
jgi:succinate dehydrogenase / fumarate reductase cytochrome b subunit